MGIKDLFQRMNNDGYNGEEMNDYNDGYGAEDEVAETEEAYQEPARETPAFNSVNLSGSAIELKVVKPTSFNNAPQIADHLLGNRTVVLNLEVTNKETAKRLIDFLSGIAYAIRGDIRKVANNTYVISPGNVSVTGDSIPEAAGEAEAEEKDTLKF